MKYQAIHLANSIIRYTWGQKKPYNEMCLLKLMKLCYITLGNYLAVKDDDFFDEKVEAWRYGPVIPSIWHEFKSFFLYNEITRLGEDNEETFKINNRTNDDNFLWKLVIDVCNKYQEFNPNSMVELTHGEGTPWYTHKKELLEGKQHVVITKEEIRTYYKENQDKLVGTKKIGF